MSSYIAAEESISYRLGNQLPDMLEAIVRRYIGRNVPTPYTYRAYDRNGFAQTEGGAYELNLLDRLPEAPRGAYAYMAGMVWCDSERTINLELVSYGPIRMYVNKRLAYRSNVMDDVLVEPRLIEVQFAKGWNVICLQARKTAAGFGCRIGAEEGAIRILQVLSPFRERQGQFGWVHSEAFSHPEAAIELELDERSFEGRQPLRWFPQCESNIAAGNEHRLHLLFGEGGGKAAYLWTSIVHEEIMPAVYRVTGAALGKGQLELWINGVKQGMGGPQGTLHCEFELSTGSHDMLLRSQNEDARWEVSLDIGKSTNEKAILESPFPVQGNPGPWLYLGAFDSRVELEPAEVQRRHRLYHTLLPTSDPDAGGSDPFVYWRTGVPGLGIRPFYENAMVGNGWITLDTTNFGRWDYPLGVTLNGLWQVAEALNLQDAAEYVHAHLTACVSHADYALWDCRQYGFPGIDHQLVLMRMLDHCGSMGATMLHIHRKAPIEGADRVAERIADFMRTKLERQDDGAFYRECPGEYLANTLWADDLYMSVPFLVRYYEMTGDASVLDDAALQFLLYKSYLYIPRLQVMSHVYDFKYKTATFVPWGRGNGWCVFALSILLEALPEEHLKRDELRSMFQSLCAGLLALQGEHGLWHQVLNDPDSFEETSCTAMFIYAFSRGLRFGWLEDQERYWQSVRLAWKGLAARSIDRHGNIHGVCMGSRYSFTAEYYKEELKTTVNDNHGVGIVLLAGAEVMRLQLSM